MTWPLQGPSQIMNSRKNETMQVVRVGAQVPQNVRFVDGKPVEVSEEKFPIVGNVQPLSGRELLIVPEFDRYKDQNWVFQQMPQKPLMINDRIERTIEGKCVNYQVQQADQWGSYTRARIMRIDVGPAATP